MGWQKRFIPGSGTVPRKKSKATIRSSGITGLPFELSLESSSETDKFHRRQDKEALKKFNNDVVQWTSDVETALKSSVRSLVKRNVSLSDSITGRVFYDSKYAREANRIGFAFDRHGVYIHRGAGKGQGGTSTTSVWINRHGERKSRAPESTGKQGTGKRQPILWFNPVVAARLPQLADLVSDYSATMQVDIVRNIFID
jgi:hypothetical protein